MPTAQRTVTRTTRPTTCLRANQVDGMVMRTEVMVMRMGVMVMRTGLREPWEHSAWHWS